MSTPYRNLAHCSGTPEKNFLICNLMTLEAFKNAFHYI